MRFQISVNNIKRKKRKMKEDKILSVEELASLLNLGKNLIYSLCRDGSIPHQKFGRKIRFSQNAVLEKLNNDFHNRQAESNAEK